MQRTERKEGRRGALQAWHSWRSPGGCRGGGSWWSRGRFGGTWSRHQRRCGATWSRRRLGAGGWPWPAPVGAGAPPPPASAWAPRRAAPARSPSACCATPRPRHGAPCAACTRTRCPSERKAAIGLRRKEKLDFCFEETEAEERFLPSRRSRKNSRPVLGSRGQLLKRSTARSRSERTGGIYEWTSHLTHLPRESRQKGFIPPSLPPPSFGSSARLRR